MTTYKLKKKFQDLLRPLAYGLDRAGVTPNQVTIAACVLSFLFSLCVILLKSSYLVYFTFPLFFFFRMALNAIDGIIAKEKNKASTVGALLNEICDLLSDFFLMSIFFFTTEVSVHWLWSMIYLAAFVECAGMWSFYIRGERSFSGPMGKSDRGIVLTLMAIVTGLGVYKGHIDIHALTNIIIITNLLLIVTLFNRLKFTVKKTDRPN